jgi:hypothetical protein
LVESSNDARSDASSVLTFPSLRLARHRRVTASSKGAFRVGGLTEASTAGQFQPHDITGLQRDARLGAYRVAVHGEAAGGAVLPPNTPSGPRANREVTALSTHGTSVSTVNSTT